MLFVDAIVLIDKTRVGLNDKLEKWRHALKFRGFILSRSKAENLRCGFSGVEGGGEEVTMGEVVVSRVEKFRYLGSIIKKRGDIDSDIDHRIRVGWQKWRNASRVLCDKKIHVRLKGRVYHMVIRPTVFYGVECWPIKKTQVQILMVLEIRMIRWMCGYTRLDKIRIVVLREKVGVVLIEEKMSETRLR